MYWLSLVQRQGFANDIEALKCNKALPKSSCLFPISSELAVEIKMLKCHILLHIQLYYLVNTQLLLLLWTSSMMHAGPAFLVDRRYYITGCRKVVRVAVSFVVVLQPNQNHNWL